MLDSPGGPSAKVGSSATFGVVVFMASILNYLGGPSAKVCSSAKYVCTGIQGKYHLSDLKSLIVIWGCFGYVSGCQGMSMGFTSDMTVPC